MSLDLCNTTIFNVFLEARIIIVFLYYNFTTYALVIIYKYLQIDYESGPVWKGARRLQNVSNAERWSSKLWELD